MQKTELIQIGKQLGISSQDIELLILHHLDISKNEYFLLDKIDNSEKIIGDLEKIAKGYPIQYIVLSCEFYGREFYVDKSVLIPRIDTELMIDRVNNKIYGEKTQYLDIGTGSGIIPITLYLELGENTQMFAFDISQDALDVCERNIKSYKLEKNIQCFNSDLLSNFGALDVSKENKLVITANLPYIKEKDFDNMSESTVLHEPDLALYGGGKNGLEIYERLIVQCDELGISGYDMDLFIEIGFDQKDAISKFLQEKQLDFEFHKDSATIERVVEIHF